MSPTTLAALAVLLAGALTGLTGFGFSVVAVPLLLPVYSPHDVVVIALVLVPVTSAVLLAMPHLRGTVNHRTVAYLTGWSLIGLPVGIALFERFDPVWVTGLMGLTLITYAFYAYFGPEDWTVPDSWLVPSGLLGGLLATSTGLSGPAVAMYVHGRRMTATAQLTTMAAYVAVISLLGFGLLTARGAVGAAALHQLLVLAPVAVLGTVAGLWLRQHMAARGDHVVERLTLVLMAAMGLWTVGRVVLASTTKGTIA
ncbi:sulfite exporter TauE/SafE family protein [Nocardioides rotundus]|uniref:sulfite exporter TauE/SafE family protein n=1 Tax=Nocardioides rotundus TaxID=1774216 RepID=UPI001CC0603C|nr:sulfite exporter TauE/SafE family protein [Nocardioides rotundus]UAL31427.1 sulfite exporter TauE/SafE family protein [Nocardioides rotundus]